VHKETHIKEKQTNKDAAYIRNTHNVRKAHKTKRGTKHKITKTSTPLIISALTTKDIFNKIAAAPKNAK